MRAVIVLLLATAAHADEGAIREETIVERNGAEVGIDSGLRMRSDGKAAVGAGLSTKLSLGEYGLGLSLMRWHPLEDTDRERSWELAFRITRFWQINNNVRAHVFGGASYERVELDIDKQTHKFGRVGAKVGGGVSWKVADDSTAWLELTLENKQWRELPPDVEREHERTVMLMFGFSF